MLKSQTRLLVALSLVVAYAAPAFAEQSEQQWLKNCSHSEQCYGKTDSRTGEMAFALGNFYHKQHQYDREAGAYTKAMHIFEQSPGKNGDMLRYYSDALARVYFEEQKLDQAEKLYKRAIEIGERLPGKDKTYVLPNTLQGLAQVYIAQNKFPQAEAALKERIELRHRFLNQGEVDIALLDLAKLYTQWGKLDQARKLYDELLTMPKISVDVKDGYANFLARSACKQTSSN